MGSWNQEAIEIIQEIVKQISSVTDDQHETTYLFQWKSIAIQRGSAVFFKSTFSNEWKSFHPFQTSLQFSKTLLKGEKNTNNNSNK